jgi:vesicle transport protein SEC22
VESVRKPYAFVGFGALSKACLESFIADNKITDTFMSKTARLYQDTRTAGGGGALDQLNNELSDVTRIMTKNMEELLWRGDSLDRRLLLFLYKHLSNSREGMSHLSTSLRSESEKYRKAARKINIDAMIRQYAPLGAVGLIVIILLWWRFW